MINWNASQGLIMWCTKGDGHIAIHSERSMYKDATNGEGRKLKWFTERPR
jgi:hypothetical protein